MKPLVVDTNVLLIANGEHDGVEPACVRECIKRLQDLMKNGVLVVDDGYRIVKEYQNKTRHKRGKQAGDVFLKWALQNLANKARCHQVPLTQVTQAGPDDFVEFPDSDLAKVFDAPDRKFAAVAYAHLEKPSILQAADCKWLDWWQRLRDAGIEVEFVCPAEVTRFYGKKFPLKSPPGLP